MVLPAVTTLEHAEVVLVYVAVLIAVQNVKSRLRAAGRWTESGRTGGTEVEDHQVPGVHVPISQEVKRDHRGAAVRVHRRAGNGVETQIQAVRNTIAIAVTVAADGQAVIIARRNGHEAAVGRGDVALAGVIVQGIVVTPQATMEPSAFRPRLW
jgi:hypothetical protein